MKVYLYNYRVPGGKCSSEIEFSDALMAISEEALVYWDRDIPDLGADLPEAVALWIPENTHEAYEGAIGCVVLRYSNLFWLFEPSRGWFREQE